MEVVTGAFSYTGRAIAEELLRRGASVRTLTRRDAPADPLATRIERAPLRDDRDRGEDGVDKGPSSRLVGRVGQLDPDQQLGDGDGGHGDVVLVTDQVVEPQSPALSGDHDRRIEDQPVQSRSSAVNDARSVASSAGHDVSAVWSRRSRLTSSPLADGTGVMRAMGFPARVTT